MSRQVGNVKGAKARADKYFSLIVRSRGRCEDCGSQLFLQCAHVISRRFSNTRCDERNALCLCAKCHHYYTDHPVAWGVFIIERMGQDGYWRLTHQSEKTTKVDWISVAAELKARWEAIEAAA